MASRVAVKNRNPASAPASAPATRRKQARQKGVITPFGIFKNALRAAAF